ncbi:MAG: hypothetical protein LRY56_06690 [Burkholderiaceae bacterium]|nr:hypothetical protein [Burkholderiaceae bacterium]
MISASTDARLCLTEICRRKLLVFGAASVAACLSGCTHGLVAKEVPPSDQAAQAQAVQAFYSQVVKLQIFGVPTEEQLRALTPVISEKLAMLLRQARAAEHHLFARHGGAEPPLMQGALLVSLFEGANRFDSATPTAEANVWQATLAYGQGVDTVQWVDRVWLVRAQPQQHRSEAHRMSWVVDDIQFSGQWDFARQGRLSEALQAIIEQAYDQ